MKTNKFFTVVLLLCGSQSLLAQSLSLTASSHAMQAGDIIKYELVKYATPKESFSGNCLTWDFSSSKYLDVEKEIQFFQKDGIHTRMIGDAIVDFIQTPDSMYLSGVETPLVTLSLGKSLAYARYPFVEGDSLVSYFTGSGTFCFRNALSVSGTGSIHAVASGKLILPDNETIEASLLIKRTIEARVLVSKDSLTSDQPMELRFDATICEWYGAGNRYPVFKTVVANLEDGKHMLTSYRKTFGLSEESMVAQVPSVLESRGKTGKQGDGVNGDGASDKLDSHLSVSGKTATLSYSITEPSRLQFTVSSFSGIVYQSMTKQLPAGQGYLQEFNCSSLPSGEYVLYIKVNDQLYSEKFHIK